MKNIKISKFSMLLLILIGVIIYLRFCLIVPISISGRSMEPTLKDGERGFVYRTHDVKRTDIVTIQTSNKNIIKRVIAVGGDHLVIKGNEIFINDQKLLEDYLTGYPKSTMVNTSKTIILTIPRDSYFVLGDNRQNSFDSRTIGPISKNKIIGKLIASFSFSIY